MKSAYRYVPVVKGKMNDAKAVARLSDDAKSSVKPLLELMPWLQKKSTPTIDSHLEKFVNYASDHLSGIPLMVDMYGFLPGQKVSSGKLGVIAGFEELIKRGHQFTPVFGLNRDDAVWQGLKPIVKQNGAGFCFRLEKDDIDDAAQDTWHELIERSAGLGVKPESTDVVLDLRDIRQASVMSLRDVVIEFLAANPKVSQFRSVTFVASSALKTVASIKPDGHEVVSRNELLLWLELRKDVQDEVNLVFGDYGMVHPYFSDGGNAKYINAKIRYTNGTGLHYLRGHGLNYPVKDYEQYRDLAMYLTKNHIFKGASYSFGDSYIADCANGITKTPGSPQTWIIAEMNHHLTVAAHQVQVVESLSLSASDEAVVASLESA